MKSEKKEACLAVLSCSQPRAVVGGLKWLYRLFVLQFCNVFQLSFLFLYHCIYFLMILLWGVSAKRRENQRQQSFVSLSPARGASEDFAFHTSFTAWGCEAATKPAPAQPASRQQKQQLAARIQNFTAKSCGEKYSIKNYHFWKVSVTAEIKPFCSMWVFSFKLNSPAYTKMLCVLKEM